MAGNVFETNTSTIIGIDIGTSRIAAVIATIEKSQLELLDFCSVPFEGTGWDAQASMENS